MSMPSRYNSEQYTPITMGTLITPLSSGQTRNRLSKMFSIPSKRKHLVIPTPESLKSDNSYDKRFSSPNATLINLDDLSSFSSSNSSLQRSKRVSRFNFKDFRCIFCDESLTSVLEDEDPPITLTCSHKCHPECFLMMVDRKDLTYELYCNTCHTETKCEDEIVEETMMRKRLLQDEDEEDESLSSINEAIETSTPTSSLKLTLDHVVRTPERQIIGHESYYDSDTESHYSIENEILSEIISPKVSFSPEVSRQNLSLPKDQPTFQQKCFLNVRAPSYQVSLDDHSEALLLVTNEMMHRLNEDIEDWKGLHLAELGELICFDFLRVGTTEDEFITATCFMFQTVILIVDLTQTKIEGTVQMDHISSCVESDDMLIQLNLKNGSLPMIYLDCHNKIIIRKWFNLISKIGLLKPDEELEFDNNQLIQLSTNAWSLIEKNQQSVPFSHLSPKMYQMTIPKPPPLPISFTICISLVNNTQLSNDEYLLNLQQLIRDTKDSLTERDSLGLVTIGKNPITGEFAPSGSYIGMAKPTWSDWDEIIEKLEVTDTPVFQDEYEQLVQALLHSSQLITSNSEFKHTKRVKKLVIVSNLPHESHIDESVSRQREREIQSYLCTILQRNNIELDSVLIGETYSLKYLYYLSNSLKIITRENDHYHVTVGARSHRYDSYHELPITEFITQLKDVIIPDFQITLNTNSLNDVLISSIENPTNGEFIPLDPQLDKLTLSIPNLRSNDCKSFLLNLQIEKSQFKKGSFQNLTIANIQGQWFSTTYETEISRSSIEIALSDQYINSSMQDLETISEESLFSSEMVDLPLLPPLISSQREILYIKREIELIFILSLLQTVESNNTKILELMSLIWGILKSCEGHTLVRVRDRSLRMNLYIEEICLKAESVQELLQNSKTKFDGIKKGYDLCFQIALQ